MHPLTPNLSCLLAPGRKTRNLSFCLEITGTYASAPPDIPKLLSSQLVEVPTAAKSASTNHRVPCPGPEARVAAASCSCFSASRIAPSHLLSAVRTWPELLRAFYGAGSIMLLPSHVYKMMARPPRRSTRHYFKLDKHKSDFTETNPHSVIDWIQYS